MVVYIVNASRHVSLPVHSKYYIINQGLLDQYRLTERACYFSSECPTSYSTDTHICSWKLPSSTQFLFHFWVESSWCSKTKQRQLIKEWKLELLQFCKTVWRFQQVILWSHSIFTNLQETATSTFPTPQALEDRMMASRVGQYDNKFVKCNRFCHTVWYCGSCALNITRQP